MKTLSNNRNYFTAILVTLTLVCTSFYLNAQSNTDALNTPEEEETIELENWMTNFDAFANTPNEDNPITLAVFLNDDFEEENLAIADWMLDMDSYLINAHDNFNFALLEEEENESIAIEAWMTSLETFYDVPTHVLPSKYNINIEAPANVLMALHNTNK